MHALERRGVRVIDGVARVVGPNEVSVRTLQDEDAEPEVITSDAILVAVGASPRELPTAVPDGERIFNWKQLYAMTELPEHLIVVGSGVTGAEFASAYNGLGSKVTLISSRDQVLPGEDTDAAKLLESVFERRGVRVLSRSRANAVERTDDGVKVTLGDGSEVTGSHCLVCVGSIPNTAGLGLEEAGVVVIHGSAFGPGGEGTLRISFAAGGTALEQGLDRLREGLLRQSALR